jgi:hypothetical protein
MPQLLLVLLLLLLLLLLEVMLAVVAVEAGMSAGSCGSAAVTSASILSKSSLSSSALPVAAFAPWRLLVFLFFGMPARIQKLSAVQCGIFDMKKIGAVKLGIGGRRCARGGCSRLKSLQSMGGSENRYKAT